MRDIWKFWSRGRTNYRLLIRWSTCHWSLRYNPLVVVAGYFLGFGYLGTHKRTKYPPRAFGIEFCTHPGSSRCYCPGKTTEFSVNFGGAFLWLDLSRDWETWPCKCDMAIWSVFPEKYEEALEENEGAACEVAA